MGKELSIEAKVAILEKVRAETDRILNNRFADLEKKIIEELTENVKKFLLDYSEQIVEKSKKDYKKRVRVSINCILEGYKELKDFVENTKRKLLMLQKIYIEGMAKSEFDEDYLTNKTFANDKKSLIEDLAVLLFGVDGLNYRILERKGLDI